MVPREISYFSIHDHGQKDVFLFTPVFSWPSLSCSEPCRWPTPDLAVVKENNAILCRGFGDTMVKVAQMQQGQGDPC